MAFRHLSGSTKKAEPGDMLLVVRELPYTFHDGLAGLGSACLWGLSFLRTAVTFSSTLSDIGTKTIHRCADVSLVQMTLKPEAPMN